MQLKFKPISLFNTSPRAVVLLFLCLMATLCCYSTTLKGFIVNYQDNQPIMFSFSESPKILFQDENVIIKTSQTSISIPCTSFKSIEYVSTNSIENCSYAPTSYLFQVRGNELLIHSTDLELLIELYDIKGMKISNSVIKGGEALSFNLAHGIYLVSINHKTYKIQIG